MIKNTLFVILLIILSMTAFSCEAMDAREAYRQRDYSDVLNKCDGPVTVTVQIGDWNDYKVITCNDYKFTR